MLCEIAMLDLVDVGERSVESYRGVAPDLLLEQLREVSRKLQGARVLHLSATPYGGGVSELLRSTVPLLNDLGLKAEWRIVTGNQTFFEVTKAIHNGLQGGTHELNQAQQTSYLETARANARAFSGAYDFVFVHDPQPAGILAYRGKEDAHWIWRCHIDTSCPNRQIWSFLRPFVAQHDAAIFTLPDFIPPDFPLDRVEIIAPAIDPQSPKNLPLPEPIARQLLEWIGVRTQRPLVTQVSRFDPWKDPLGVIRAYCLAREQIPQLQLALVGSLALDDPEGWDIYRGIEAEVGADPDIHVFTNLVGVGNIEVNAFQTLSAVVIQKSIREGFGLVVAESLWKGTAVVAGRTGGIPMQMPEGVGGILVDTVEQCAEGIVTLVKDRERAKVLGASGRARVRELFLIPRLVRDELALMARLAAGDSHPFGRRGG